MALTEQQKKFKKIFCRPHHIFTVSILNYFRVRGGDDPLEMKTKPSNKEDLLAVQVKMANGEIGCILTKDVKHFCNLPNIIE